VAGGVCSSPSTASIRAPAASGRGNGRGNGNGNGNGVIEGEEPVHEGVPAEVA
jgi:hypothetical protein